MSLHSTGKPRKDDEKELEISRSELLLDVL